MFPLQTTVFSRHAASIAWAILRQRDRLHADQGHCHHAWAGHRCARGARGLLLMDADLLVHHDHEGKGETVLRTDPAVVFEYSEQAQQRGQLAR